MYVSQPFIPKACLIFVSRQPRAEKEQYDGWGVLNDDPQWTWEALLPYFKKSESFVSPDEYQVQNDVRDLEEVHGTSSEGRVKVGFPNYFYPQSQLWASAIDFEPSPDLADGKPQGTVGVSPNALDAHNNTRYVVDLLLPLSSSC